MTATQLTLGDCDPAWNDLGPGQAARWARPRPSRRAPAQPRTRDLRGQRISRKHRIVDVPVVGDYL